MVETSNRRRLRSEPFPAPLGPRLRSAVAVAHAEEPFHPTRPRDSAHRVATIARQLGLQATIFRGAVDVGGAEVDHLWVVASERVIDPALPLHAPRFVAAIRSFVAGDLDEEEFERLAHPYSVRWRVLGSYPADCRYLGAPLWGES